jgi:hypothetical protein
VVLRRVERVEVEDLVFDVGAVGEREAEAAKDLDGAVARLQDGMERAGRLVAAGQRGIEVGGLGGGRELGLFRVESGGDFVLGRVGGLADDGLLVAGDLGHALEQLGPASAAREVLDADFLERVGRRRAGDGAEDFFTEGLDFVEHGRAVHDREAGFTAQGKMGPMGPIRLIGRIGPIDPLNVLSVLLVL